MDDRDAVAALRFFQSAAELRSDLQMLRRDLDSGHAALNEIDDGEKPSLKSTRLVGTGATILPDASANSLSSGNLAAASANFCPASDTAWA